MAERGRLSAAELKPIRKRAARAYENRTDWARLTNEMNDFTLPHRTPMDTSTGAGGKSARYQAHDATAAKARQRFAGRLSRDLTPPFQKFQEIKLGASSKAVLLKQLGEKQAKVTQETLNRVLERVTAQVQAIFERAEFALSAEEMYLDLFGGQGAMLILEDDDLLVDFVAVPVAEIALREDGRGRVIGIYWRKMFEVSDLPFEWPETTFSEDLARKVANDNAEKVPIVQASEFDRKSKKWNFIVYRDEKEDEAPIYQLTGSKTSPWITPRFYKVAGEAHGRGPGLMALPTIKTLDKVTELTLKAAAFAVLGLWIYRNDRAFNPRTSVMAPGKMWPVSFTGGQMGPAVQKLDVPGRFDVGNLILQDLREQVKQITFDDTLPPDSGAVRSATEIVERIRRLQNDLSGAFARLVLEIVVPLVKRVVDILERKGLINLDGLPLDQLALKIEVTSSIARSQQAQDISNDVNWLQIMLSTGGQELMFMIADIEEVFTDIGRKLGVSETKIRSSVDREKIQRMVAEIIAKAQLGAAQAQQPGGSGQPPSEENIAAAG